MVHPLIMGLCSPAYWAQLKGSKGFEQIETDQDVLELLKLSHRIRYKHDQNTDETYAVIMSVKNLFYFYQKPETPNDEYLKEFKARVESINNFDACILRKFPCLVKKNLKKYKKN